MKHSIICVLLAAALLCPLLCSCSGEKEPTATTTTVAASPIENTYGNYKYKLLSDGTAKITKYTAEQSDIEIYIPDSLNGTKVTVIGVDSFAGVAGLTVVTLPTTITSIEDGAFAGSSVKKIFIHKSSVVSIGKNAFAGCENLVQADLPKTLESLGSGAFAGCSALLSATFRGNTADIADDAFAGCPDVTLKGADSFDNVKSYCEENSLPFTVSSAVSGHDATTAAE